MDSSASGLSSQSPMPTILACINRSESAQHVIEHAAWGARRIAELVRVMHVVPLAVLVARTSVNLLADRYPLPLAELQSEGEEITHDLFDHARAILSKSGISTIATVVRSGEVPLPEKSAFAGIALAVIGKRGEGSTSARRGVGQNVGRPLAGQHPPMLIVMRPVAPIRSLLIAFDGRPAAQRAVSFLVESPLLRGAHGHLLEVGRNKGVLQREFEAARARLESAGYVAQARWLPGEPERVLPDDLKYEEFDLLAMGSFGDTRASRIRGSTTAALLNAGELPLLVF